MSKQQDVKIRYAWDVQKKRIAQYLIHYTRPVLRPALRVVDWLELAWLRFDAFAFEGYSAESYDDLTLSEYLRVRWCEFRARHVGRRVNMHKGYGAHHCTFCQCDWKKFDNHPRNIARRRALAAKRRYPATDRA